MGLPARKKGAKRLLNAREAGGGQEELTGQGGFDRADQEVRAPGYPWSMSERAGLFLC